MKKRRDLVLRAVFLALLVVSVGIIWLFRQWIFVNPWKPFPLDNVVYTAKDSDGSILVLDDAGNRLVKIRDGYVVWKVNGSEDTFSNAKRLATDAAGNIYVQSAFIKGGTRLEAESIAAYSPDGEFLKTAVRLDSADRLRLQIGGLLSAGEDVLWVWRMEDEVLLMDMDSGIVEKIPLPDADRMALNFTYDPATETLWYSTYSGKILRSSKGGEDAVLYDSAAVGNGKQSIPWTISYADGILYATDYGMRDTIVIRTDTGEVSRLEPEIPLLEREIAHELNATHGLVEATSYSVMEWDGESFDYRYDAMLDTRTQLKCIVLWIALIFLAVRVAIALIFLSVRFFRKSQRFAKIGVLIVVGAMGLGWFILGTLMPYVYDQYAVAVYARERLAATVTAEQLPIASFLELDSPSDFYSEDYIAVKEAVDHVFFANTEDAKNLYCGLWRVLDGVITQVYALDDTCVVYPFDVDYETSIEKEILTSGEGQTLVTSTSEGRFIFVLLPILDGEGTPVGLIEVGTDMTSYEKENQRMFISILINILAIIVVLIFISTEVLHFAHGRDEYKLAREQGVVLSILPARILRFVVFLICFITCLTTAIMPLYAMSISQTSHAFGLRPELLAAIPISAEVIAGAVVSILGSRILQRFGIKRSVRICAILFTFGLALRIIPDIWLLTLGNVIAGVGWGVLFLLVNIQISSMPEEEKDAGFEHYNAAMFGGINSGVVVGGFLLQWLSYTALFIVTAVVSITLYFLATRYLEKLPDYQKKKEESGGMLATVRFVFSPRLIVFFLMIAIPILICGYFLNYLLPILGSEWGLSDTYIGYTYLINGMCVLVFGSSLTRLFTHFRKKKLGLVFASILYAIAFTLVAKFQNIPSLIAAVALLGVSDSFGQPLQTGYFTDLQEVHDYGYDRAMGVFSLISYVAQSMGSFVFSYALLIGIGKGLFAASIALSGFALLFLCFGGRSRTKESREAS